MTKDSDSTRRIDILLGGVRAAIRKADEAFRPDPDAALYVGTDDGRINLADLLGPWGLRAPRQHPV